MRFKVLRAVAAIGALLAFCIQTPTSAGAQPLYVAGNASAFAPYWISSIQSWGYYCVFNGWAHVQVNWRCQVRLVATGQVLTSHSGEFSNGGYSTPHWSFKKAEGTPMCTYADAAYADGSSSDHDRKCN
jgi:hypothetical protein